MTIFNENIHIGPCLRPMILLVHFLITWPRFGPIKRLPCSDLSRRLASSIALNDSSIHSKVPVLLFPFPDLHVNIGLLGVCWRFHRVQILTPREFMPRRDEHIPFFVHPSFCRIRKGKCKYRTHNMPRRHTDRIFWS